MFRAATGLDPQDAVDEGEFVPLGTPEALSIAISRVFPSTQWKASSINPGVRTGGPAPEFLLNAESDGQVHSFTMARATALQVSMLADNLQLSVLDQESGELFNT